MRSRAAGLGCGALGFGESLPGGLHEGVGVVNRNEVILYVADQSRSSAFYAAVLGQEPSLQARA